ncbi:MAG: peptidylprolyl isomerase [Candidatus Sumerlaeia bacterium]|nr:peptidylprolyl isomerase [Candidatus Sumerlaeia bacterium]
MLCLLVRPASAQLDVVAAAVGNDLITHRDLDYYLFELRLFDASLEAISDDDLRREVLPSVVDEFLLYRHFSLDGAEPPPEQVTEALEDVWREYEGRAGSPERLRRLLAFNELAVESTREWVRQRALRSIITNRALAQRLDPALSRHIEDGPRNATRFLMAQIFVAPRAAGPEALNEAEQRALRIWVDVQTGLAFERAAAVFSDDPASSSRGGQTGWIDAGLLAPAVREAVQTLTIGEISRPVQGSTGFHLLKLLDYETPLRRQRLVATRAERDRTLARLRREADIHIAPDYAERFEGPDVDVQEPSVWQRITGRQAHVTTAPAEEVTAPPAPAAP